MSSSASDSESGCSRSTSSTGTKRSGCEDSDTSVSALGASDQRPSPKLPPSFPAIPEDLTPGRVDERDIHSPDNWVHRNPNLVRLTGKHPFNAEAPLAALYEAGFITPAHLHFVRNHGYVPQVDAHTARTWTIHVGGVVERPCAFTLQELRERFSVVTLPVTLVCAGNRRKEQNVVRKSLGFDWGAAGVSTALWTGVYLADVLTYVKPVRPGAKHVVFEGVDQLPQGPYGTSQRLSWAANREKGMLVAWAMNGRPLEPDHGFPVRVIIPGQIGGRSVKWLSKIEVSDKESQHHLHFWDNKMLPRHLTPEQARGEKEWWYDSKYLITELNVNSAVARPDHNEVLHIKSPCDRMDDTGTYTIRGYAYSGGGRRVTRCEVSLDEGKTWRLAKMNYPEDLYRALCYSDEVFGSLDLTERDTSFCWCFWSLEVSLAELAKSAVIQVCAVDESVNMQPRDMYLNATSMMNNCMFKVTIVKTSEQGGLQLRFEHPTLAGTAKGGWMQRLKATGQDLLNPKFSDQESTSEQPSISDTTEASGVKMTKSDVQRKITVEELTTQDKQRPWFVVDGEVYDGTEYLQDHPGGADSILLVAGEDATEDFMAIHSTDAKTKLAEYHIGTLEGTLDGRPKDEEVSAGFLHPKTWKSVVLKEAAPVNHDTYTFKFALPEPECELGLPIGQHLFVRVRNKETGEMIQRAYTPVSRAEEKCGVELLVKLYLPSIDVRVGGKMSMALHKLRDGDTVEVKGPLGSFVWNGGGYATWKSVRRKVSRIGMICGGSGITPILQVLRGIFHDESDGETEVWMIDSNKTEADILCKAELDELVSRHALRLHLFHTLSAPPAGWRQGIGRVTESIIAKHLPVAGGESLVLVCGPEGMVQNAVKPALVRHGWDIENRVVVF